MSYSITNVQGIVSKAALAGQMQDATNRGHELSAEHVAEHMKEEHAINQEKVEEAGKPEESMDRDANPEDMQNSNPKDDQTIDEEEIETDNILGHPDANGHIDFTV